MGQDGFFSQSAFDANKIKALQNGPQLTIFTPFFPTDNVSAARPEGYCQGYVSVRMLL